MRGGIAVSLVLFVSSCFPFHAISSIHQFRPLDCLCSTQAIKSNAHLLDVIAALPHSSILFALRQRLHERHNILKLQAHKREISIQQLCQHVVGREPVVELWQLPHKVLWKGKALFRHEREKVAQGIWAMAGKALSNRATGRVAHTVGTSRAARQAVNTQWVLPQLWS